MSTPAELLNGEINGWIIQKKMESYPGQSGGNFSTGYIVSKGGVTGFMKAMDLHSVLPRGLEIIQKTIQLFLFEQGILRFCQDKRLSHIVKMIDHGEYLNPAIEQNDINKIYYMVFEWSDGDIRREITFEPNSQNSWKMHVLHQVAIAICQLHKVNIAHQDVKPSNVLGFKEDKQYKLGDLGRSTAKHSVSPADDIPFPGDTSYAPPEIHYGYIKTDFQERRFTSDAYLLGSMIGFLFSTAGALTATLMNMPDEYSPTQWTGTYEDVLPYLVSAHTKSTEELKKYLPNGFSDELADIYFNLCHPDPFKRGNPKTRAQAGRPLGLNVYLSRFNHIETKLRINESIAKKI